MNTLPTTNKKGNIALILMIVVAIAAVGLLYYQKVTAPQIPSLPSLPSQEERTNPEPQSGYSIEVSEVQPGTSVEIKTVELGTTAKVAVYKQNGDKWTLIGSSSLLPVGISNSVSVKLSSKISDGDVIDIKLLDENGKVITDSSKSEIHVQKPVGMIMMHYQNEY